MKNELSIISIILLSLFCLKGCSTNETPYLRKSIKVSNWLKEQKVDSSENEIWVDEVGIEKVSLSLSSGVSGKVLFYLQLHLATDNQTFLEEAVKGCDYIEGNLPQNVEQAASIRNGTSLYGDIAGSAFVLMETYKITKDERWKKTVNHCLSLIDSLSIKPDGRYWNRFNDVLVGSAGTGLLLLYLHEETGDHKPLQMAQEAADMLMQRSVMNQDSLYWYINQDNEINLPNFSHGAAGIGYFFARLYEVTGDVNYLKTALKVADYLEIIAWQPENSFLLPYGFPDYGWDRSYDIGWAHGPAGTSRFFFQLWLVTDDSKWLERVKQCSNGIKQSGLPDTPNEHFGKTPFPIDMRFGLGSVIDFYINLKKHNLLDTNDNYLDILVNKLDEESINSDSLKRYWQIERYGFMGNKGELTTYTGYFYGASGLGQIYIRLNNLILEKDDVIKLPDDPF